MRSSSLVSLYLCMAVSALALTCDAPAASAAAPTPSLEGSHELAGDSQVPFSLAKQAAAAYARLRWPDCRFVAVTPYYAFDGSINAYAFQFARAGSPLDSEEAIRESVAEAEHYLAGIRLSQPGAPPERESSRVVASPVVETVLGDAGATCVAVHARIDPSSVEEATDRVGRFDAHSLRMEDWERQVRAAANAATLSEQIGTVIVAARADLYPLLEMSEGVAPHVQFESKVRRLADISDDEPIGRAFYVGPMAVFLEPSGAKTDPGKLAPDRVVNVRSGETIDFRTRKATGSLGRLPAAPTSKRSTPPQQVWQAIAESDSWVGKMSEKPPSLAPERQVTGVPFLHQDNYAPECCSEVGAAQALGYWDARGYGTLIDKGDAYTYGHEEELVYALMHAMGYKPPEAENEAGAAKSGTSSPNINDGIMAVCSHPLYGNELSVLSDEISYGDIEWDHIKLEVNNWRPFVYSVTQPDDPDAYPNWRHSVTCVGFRSDDSGAYIYVHDNYPPDSLRMLNWLNIPSDYETMATVETAYSMRFDTLISEDFEDGIGFPGHWAEVSFGATEAYWTEVAGGHNSYTFNPYPPPGGDLAHSAYAPTAVSGTQYLPNIDTWRIIGPLTMDKTAGGDFSAYILGGIPDAAGDAVQLLASVDGSNFYGLAWFGTSTDWNRVALNLGNVPVLGNIVDEPRAWLAVRFQSDGDNLAGTGILMDDIAARIYPNSQYCVTLPIAGDILLNQNSYGITWDTVGPAYEGNVKIELFSGNQLHSVITPGTSNTGWYGWFLGPSPIPPGTYWIRLSNSQFPTLRGSSYPFDIQDAKSILLLQPNGGQSLARGSRYRIMWHSTGYIGNTVDLLLYRGTTFNRTIASGVPITGYYDWDIPSDQTVAGDYLIQVNSTQSPSTKDWSDSPFEIRAPTIYVNRPNVSDWWYRGDTYTIAWDWEGDPGPLVKIDLLRRNPIGLTIKQEITASTPNDGAFNWPVPSDQLVSDRYRIRVTSLSNSAYVGTSDYFAITTATVRLLSPDGGEQWARGLPHTIAWQAPRLGRGYRPVQLDIFRTDDPYMPLQPHLVGVIKNRTGTTKTELDWYTSPSLPRGSYRIRVSLIDDFDWDWSDFPFQIVEPRFHILAPLAHDLWIPGTTNTIAWDRTDIPRGRVQLQLRRDDGSNTQTIVRSVPDTGYYRWFIPLSTPTGGGYRVHIRSMEYPGVTGDSTEPFSMGELPGIRVTTPNGHEVWGTGEFHWITWNSSGLPDSTVRIELYRDSALDHVIAFAPLASGRYRWFIPNSQPEAVAYRVRVRSMYDPSFRDISNTYFTIEHRAAARKQWLDWQ